MKTLEDVMNNKLNGDKSEEVKDSQDIKIEPLKKINMGARDVGVPHVALNNAIGAVAKRIDVIANEDIPLYNHYKGKNIQDDSEKKEENLEIPENYTKSSGSSEVVHLGGESSDDIVITEDDINKAISFANNENSEKKEENLKNDEISSDNIEKKVEETTNKKEVNVVEVNESVIDKGKRKRRDVKVLRNDSKYKRYRQKSIDNAHRVAIPMLNSGYIAAMAGYKTLELAPIMSAQESSAYDKYSTLYNKLYDKLKVNNVSGFTYDNFLKLTSSFEASLLLYAAYKASVADEHTEMDFKCPKCKSTFTHREANSDLLKYKDESKVIEVVENMKTGTAIEVLESSNVNNIVTEYLDTGAIVEIRHPSLYQHLDMLGKITPNLAKNYPVVLGYAIYIERLLIPTGEIIDGVEEVFEVTELEDILYEITNFDDSLVKALSKAVGDFGKGTPYTIGLHDIRCTKCNHELAKFNELDMEEMLFISPEQNARQKQ